MGWECKKDDLERNQVPQKARIWVGKIFYPRSSAALRQKCEGLPTAFHRDLRSNVISTVQPGAFLGLGELKRL